MQSKSADKSHKSSHKPLTIRAEQLFESLPNAAALLDESGKFLQANKVLHELCGYSQVDLSKMLPIDLLVDTDGSRELLSAPHAITRPIWLRHSNGNKFKVIAQIYFVDLKNNKYRLLHFYSLNEEGLGSYFIDGITNDGTWVWDFKKSTTWRSRKWLEIGEQKDAPALVDVKIITTNLEFVNASDDREALERKLSENNTLIEGEAYLKMPSGKRKHVSWQGQVIEYDTLGKPICSTGSLRDMTTYMERNTNIVQARELVLHHARLLQLGEIMATVSHELNQPLSAIASYASVCKSGVREDGETGKLIRLIETQALRAGELLRRIRAFAHRGSCKREHTLLVPVIQDVLEWMRTDIRCKDSALNFYSPSPLLPEKISIFCERIEIEQILINLIVNAATAAQSMPLPKGHHVIDIYIECDDSSSDKIHVVVADRGPGLPEDFIDKAFSPFTTTRPNGLGLGLSICRTIAADLGGELSYKPREGGGAMFILSLLRCDSDE